MAVIGRLDTDERGHGLSARTPEQRVRGPLDDLAELCGSGVNKETALVPGPTQKAPATALDPGRNTVEKVLGAPRPRGVLGSALQREYAQPDRAATRRARYGSTSRTGPDGADSMP